MNRAETPNNSVIFFFFYYILSSHSWVSAKHFAVLTHRISHEYVTDNDVFLATDEATFIDLPC